MLLHVQKITKIMNTIYQENIKSNCYNGMSKSSKSKLKIGKCIYACCVEIV